METNVTNVASITNATTSANVKDKNSSKVQKQIKAGDKYGTFNELVAELGKLGKAGAKEKYKEKGYVTKYYDTDGNFVGGTYTRPEKNGKYTGTVTIGDVTYTAEDIKKEGLVKSIIDSKKGTFAKDRNNDGIINPSEIFNFWPTNVQ